MNYRLFLSDFDGTLVRSDGTVSEKNKRAIARYVAAGGTFAVWIKHLRIWIVI